MYLLDYSLGCGISKFGHFWQISKKIFWWYFQTFWTVSKMVCMQAIFTSMARTNIV